MELGQNLKDSFHKNGLKSCKKKDKIGILMDQVIYARLFLTGKALEWFKPYLMEIQTNKITTLNQEVRYMFLS